jgi:hypothetical protein
MTSSTQDLFAKAVAFGSYQSFSKFSKEDVVTRFCATAVTCVVKVFSGVIKFITTAND